MYIISNKEGKIVSEKHYDIKVHPTSVLCKKDKEIDPIVFSTGANWIVHGEKSSVSKYITIRNNTLIPNVAVLLFAGGSNLNRLPAADQNEDVIFKIDEWIQCIADEKKAQLLGVCI